MRATTRWSVCGLISWSVCIGCAEWEETPDDAVGFLGVSNATLEGTLGDVEVSEQSVRRKSGWCTQSGWEVELATTTSRGTVMSNIRLADLLVTEPVMNTAWTRSETDGEELVLDANAADMERRAPSGDESTADEFAEDAVAEDEVAQWFIEPRAPTVATARVVGCAGQEDGNWEIEEHARKATIKIERRTDSEMHVRYEAEFADGNEVRGQFDMRMPTTD